MSLCCSRATTCPFSESAAISSAVVNASIAIAASRARLEPLQFTSFKAFANPFDATEPIFAFSKSRCARASPIDPWFKRDNSRPSITNSALTCPCAESFSAAPRLPQHSLDFPSNSASKVP